MVVQTEANLMVGLGRVGVIVHVDFGSTTSGL